MAEFASTLSEGNSDARLSATPSSPPAGSLSTPPPRPSTPPQPTQLGLSSTPHTPRPPASSGAAAPTTPATPGGASSTPLHAASVYLSSPIRRARHNSHSHYSHSSHHGSLLLQSGAMTPGRPAPHRAARVLSFWPGRGSGGSSGASAASPGGTGRVQLDTPETPERVPAMPLQTLLMTVEQAQQQTDLERTKEFLVLAIEQSERFRNAAQQFRNHANNLSFQQRLTQIERDESEQRHEVESNIQQREIEKLVTDIMGYSDKSIGAEQIRKRLRRTKNRVREMEELLEVKNDEILALRARLARVEGTGLASASASVPVPVPAPAPVLSDSSPGRPRPPPINTQFGGSVGVAGGAGAGGAASSSSTTSSRAASSSAASSSEPLSALEVLASQVLSSGIQRSEFAEPLTSSPYQASFYSPFSPYAAPPSRAQFGSPEKRRRPSSSSTISVKSEDDTLEEPL